MVMMNVVWAWTDIFWWEILFKSIKAIISMSANDWDLDHSHSAGGKLLVIQLSELKVIQ